MTKVSDDNVGRPFLFSTVLLPNAARSGAYPLFDWSSSIAQFFILFDFILIVCRMAFFGASWKSFIAVSHDNRVCLFDAETKKESRVFVEKNHLTHTYTAFDWLGGKSGARDLFTAGCSDGTVIVWDLTRGIVIKTIKVADKAVPTAVNFSLDHKSVYVSTADNNVLHYDVATGELQSSIKCGKKAVLKLKCNPKANVMAIATSSSVRIMDLDDTEEKKKCEGSYAGGLKCLAFSQCGKYLVCASANSREVVIYNIQSAGEVDNNEVSILCTVPTVGICDTVTVHHNKHTNQLYVGVVLEDKDAAVLRVNTKTLAVSSSALISKSTETFSIFALSFDSSSTSKSNGGTTGAVVHVAVGRDKSKPQFQAITCEDNNGKLLENISLVYSSKASGDNNTTTASTTSDEIITSTVMGPLDTVTSSVRPTADTETSSSSSKRKNSDLSDSEAVLSGSEKKKSKKAKKEAEATCSDEESKPKSVSFVLDHLNDPAATDNMTLEQRLEALSSSMLRDESDDDDDEEEGEEGAALSAVAALGSEAPTSDSLVVLLEQSLQSGDDVLLEHCLACNDDDVIEETSKRLPITKIVQFLRKLVTKFEKRPSRGVLLTKWLSGILKFHLSYLVTIPDLTLQLAGLSQMLENRLSSYSRLASLSGRLDLLVGQVQMKSTLAAEASAATKKGKSKPSIVYDAA